MKAFFKDYWDLYKQSGDFCKKHWKGILVLNAVLIGGELIYCYRNEIVDTVKEKLPKRKEP